MHVTPHQRRQNSATLLLRSGVPVLTAQTMFGHRHVHTTLGYARLYGGTVAADCYRAMAQIEPRLEGADAKALPQPGELLALVDSLQAGALNGGQRETVQALRAAVPALAKTV